MDDFQSFLSRTRLSETNKGDAEKMIPAASYTTNCLLSSTSALVEIKITEGELHQT